MYKPNFCAECGERVARTRWHFYTSRSFCPDCEGRFRSKRLLVPLIAALALFAVGLAAGRATRTPPPPLVVERGELPLAPATNTKAAKSASEDAEAETSNDSSSASKPEQRYGPDGTANERPTDPAEIVSICGARTQKGTPCQRRVRGTGRCWQHRGMPAIIPQEKLIITGK